MDETDEIEDSKVEMIFGARVLRSNDRMNNSQRLTGLVDSFQKRASKKPSEVGVSQNLHHRHKETISEANLNLLNDDDHFANFNRETMNSNFKTNKQVSNFGDEDLNRTMRSKSEHKAEQAFSISTQSKRYTSSKLPPIKNARGQQRNQGSQRQSKKQQVAEMSINEYEKLIVSVTVSIISNNKYMYDTYIPTLKILANKDNRLPISFHIIKMLQFEFEQIPSNFKYFTNLVEYALNLSIIDEEFKVAEKIIIYVK